MALFTPKFRPGVNKQDSDLYNEGGFQDANHIRFTYGLPQPVGGWLIKLLSQLSGKARSMHSWRTIDGRVIYAIGTSSKLYAVMGGELRDITPRLHEGTKTDIFTTVSGSDEVTVYIDQHRLDIGDTVTFSNHQSTVGGLTIDGSYTVASVPTVDTFTITAASNAGSTVSTPGGGAIDLVVPLPAGTDDTPLSGFGSGTWGGGDYGGSLTGIVEARTWALDNWGENLIANPSGYGIFEYQTEILYNDLVYNGDFAASDGWGLGTDWTIGSGVATKTAGTAANLSQDFASVLEGGRYYEVTFDVTASAGTIAFKVNAGVSPAVISVGEASTAISTSGSYSRVFLCPADPSDIVFEADSSFAGTVDNVTLKLVDRAYRITTAPARVDSAFVDPRGLVVALGCTDITGAYSPTLIRCSDLGNNRSWVPDTGSVASEITLRGGGGRLMAGIATREQNLVWGDGGVISLQYQGQEGDAYQVRLLGTGCGLISRHAMAEHNGFVFWMANTRQFYIFRGLGDNSLGIPEIMPCPILSDVFDNLDEQQAIKCHAGINSEFSEVWFFYPDNRDKETESDVGECSRVAVASWTEKGVPWVTHQMGRTCWEAAGTLSKPLAVTTDGYVMEHEQGYTANGNPLNEYLVTSDFDIEDGDRLTAIKAIWPDFKSQGGNIEFTVYAKNYPNGDTRTFGAKTATPSTKFVPFRVLGRQLAIKMAGVTTGAFWRLGAVRVDLNKTQAGR